MAYITPNSTIKVIRDCPLEPGYAHTIYFPDIATQTSYFSNLVATGYTFSNYTYQRVNKNTIRLQKSADSLYGANYMMFQNTSYGPKWFYAFILRADYVNDVTTEIEYEIDVMQTWAFSYRLGQCFIEREHAATDAVGDNLVPENVELGEYVCGLARSTILSNAYSVCVAATFDINYQDVSGGLYGGLFSGLYHSYFALPSQAQACADFIANAGSKSDGIVAVYLVPTAFVTTQGQPITKRAETIPKVSTLYRDDGTAVNNNKLYTYPYNFLYVTNQQGNAAAYRYEFFNSTDCEFELMADNAANPSAILSPKAYKGVLINYDEKITLSGYPMLAFNIDSYKAWLAQSASNLGVNSLATATGVQAAENMAMASQGMAAETIAGGLGGAAIFAGVASALSTLYTKSLMPNQGRGSAGSQTLAAANLLDFALIPKHITPEFMTIIDDYFTAFGYACHKVKTPNISVRAGWTYTKTCGCVIHGNLPAEDAKTITGAFDRGITFWKPNYTIGDYTPPNPPSATP